MKHFILARVACIPCAKEFRFSVLDQSSLQDTLLAHGWGLLSKRMKTFCCMKHNPARKEYRG